MKKILFLTFLILPIYALATDMCARDDTMVMIFDEQINSSSFGSNKTEWTWSATFPYGHIAGEATCLSAAEGLGQTSNKGAYYGTGDYATTFIDAEPGLSGTDSNGDERKYCWCRMTHPLSSHWVFVVSYPSCVSNCANGCGYNITNTTAQAFRKGLFDSIGL